MSEEPQPPASTPQPDPIHAVTVTSGATCIECDYVLDGLTPTDQCPECGTLVAVSLKKDFGELGSLPPVYVLRLRNSARLVLLGLAVAIVLSILSLIAQGFISSAIYENVYEFDATGADWSDPEWNRKWDEAWQEASRRERRVNGVFAVISSTYIIPTIIGLWRFVSPPPKGGPKLGVGPALTRIGTALSVFVVLAWIAVSIRAALVLYDPTMPGPRWLEMIFGIVFLLVLPGLSSLLVLIGTSLHAKRLGTLATNTRLHKIASRRVWMIPALASSGTLTVPVLGIFGITVFFLGSFIASILWIMLMWRTFRVLHGVVMRQAATAELPEPEAERFLQSPVAELAVAGPATRNGRLVNRASCVNCGSTLAGLWVHADCPNCHTPAMRTIETHLLDNAPASSVRRLRVGVLLIQSALLASLAVPIFSAIGFFVFVVAIPLAQGGSVDTIEPTDLQKTSVLALGTLGLVAAAVALCVGWFRVTQVDTDTNTSTQLVPLTGAKLVRLSAIAVTLVPALTTGAIWYEFEVLYGSDGPSIFFIAAAVIAAAAVTVHAVAAMNICLQLALRGGSPILADRCRACRLAIPIWSVPGAFSLIGPAIGLILYYRTVIDLRKLLRGIKAVPDQAAPPDHSSGPESNGPEPANNPL